jgi:hypothetical protein
MAVPEEAAIVEGVIVNPERLLTPREKAAYELSLKMKVARLSPDTQAKLFSLFLAGNDCVKIMDLNKGITLGQICIARVEGKWDEKRNDHVEALLKETRQRLQQTTLESIDFLTTQLSAAHKHYGDRVKKFLQTGDQADLGGFSIHSWKAYREALELLKVVTTSPDKGKVVGEIHHHVHAEGTQSIPSVNRAMTAQEAREARQGFLKRKNEND